MPLTWILLVLLAALLGWLASVMAHGRTAGEVLTFVLGGVAGAVAAALLITPVFAGKLEPTGFSLPGLLFSLLGTILASALAAAIFRRRRPSSN
jgi:uncharacterized membrane protein YeaQ/YmgE (transglycosylase-associated protein family)